MQEDLLVKDTNRLNARLSVLVLMVLVGGLVLAACGGGGGTNTNTGTGTGATATTGGTGTDTGTGATATTGTGGTGAGATATGAAPIQTVETGTGRGLQTAGPEATAVAPGGLSTPGATVTAGTQGGTGTGTGSAGQGQAGQLAPLLAGGGADNPEADPNATLKLSLGEDPVTLDPQVESFSNEIALSSQVFAPLLALTPKNEVAQNGAESYTVSQDGKTYTFKIREHNYSDGTPVTARNYAQAIQRACDPNVAGNYSNILFDVVGCQEWRTALDATPKPNAGQLQKLQQTVEQNIKAVDDRTLQINLKNPAGYFPYVMTTWVTYPSRTDLIGNDLKNWWKDPNKYIGNGAFKLTSYTPKQQFQFQRNDNYFRGKPGIANVTYRIVGSSQQAFLAYRQGQFDVLGISADQLPQVQNDPQLKAQLKREVRPSTFYIGFNNGEPPFNNVKVRQAFAAAIDRERYIKQINNGVGQPAETLLYEGIPGYQTQVRQKFDPARAKQLLSEAGYPNGRNFPPQELPFDNTDEASQKRAVFLAQQFQQVLGVQVRAVPRDPTILQQQFEERDPKLKFYFLGWLEDYPHPQNWLSLLFANNSSLAPAGWNDKQFNELTRKADALPIEEATPLYEQAEARLTELAPVAHVIHGESLVLIKPNVRGYVGYVGQPFGFNYQPEKVYKTK